MTTIDHPTTDAPDLDLVYAIHHSLREDAAAMAATIDVIGPTDRSHRADLLRRYFVAYRGQLHAHHTHEDEVFFPALAAHVGPTVMHLRELDDQHQGLDDVLDQLGDAIDAIDAIDGIAGIAGTDRDIEAARATALGAARSLMDALDGHLSLEEAVVFPLYLQHVSGAEHLQLEQRVQAMGTPEHLAFMVPWLFDRVPAEARAEILASLPEVLRDVYVTNVAPYRAMARALERPA